LIKKIKDHKYPGFPQAFFERKKLVSSIYSDLQIIIPEDRPAFSGDKKWLLDTIKILIQNDPDSYKIPTLLTPELKTCVI